MLRKINDWSNIEAHIMGEFENIEPGWYPCVILGVAEEQSYVSHREGVRFNFDIIDGPFARYYTRQYKADARKPDRKWRGTYWQMTEGNGAPFFKGIITALEHSNPGYQFDWDETKMKNLKVGVGFRREQFEANDGSLKFTVRPYAFCDIKKAISGELATPKDKLLNPIAPTALVAPAWSAPDLFSTPAPQSPPAQPYNPYDVTSAPPLDPLDDDDDLPF